MRIEWLTRIGCLSCLLIAGCLFPVRHEVDSQVCGLAEQPLDLMVPAARDPGAPQKTPDATPMPAPKVFPERLQIPQNLPGAEAPPIELPDKPEDRERAMKKLYPPLPLMGFDLPLAPGPEGQPLTLGDLQRLAMSSNPNIRQAAAKLEAARGQAIQAGLYPNPVVGYEGDTIGTGPGPGYQGGFVEQTIITGGKLKLKQAAATMDIRNAEVALRRTQIDVMTQVRSGYFSFLVAEKRLQVARALAQFTDEVYRVQIDQVKAAQAAAYEPLQLRVLAMQARADVVQARNRVIAAWKELAAALGLPAMPPTQLAGEVDMAIPVFDYDKVLVRVLAQHTDVLTAENSIRKSRYQLKLAELTPVPDVNLRVMAQKDYTSPPNFVTPSVVVGVPVPVWDRNQGNIRSEQANLLRATEQVHSVRNDLSARVAAAYEQYQNARVILDYYRTQILPDQVRVYRGVYQRHQQQPDKVDFGNIIVAQQTLAGNITSYVRTLGDMWDAVVEVAALLQTDDLFSGVEQCEPVMPVPELPCCHPCSPLQQYGFMGMNLVWDASRAPMHPQPEPEPQRPEEEQAPLPLPPVDGGEVKP
ncbi:MAG: TolC family protein [Gemmataceae bacterium]